MIMLSLPYPVSANRYWRKTRTGRTYISADAMAYRQSVAMACKQSKVTQIVGKASLTMCLNPKMTQKGVASKALIDLDNALKVTLDALIGHAYSDDKQVKRIVIEYGEPVVNGGLSVVIDDYQGVNHGG